MTTLNYSLISQQTGEATESCVSCMLLFSLFVYSLVPLFTLSSFSFHTIAYSLGLEQNDSSGASVPVNAKTIMDIR